MDVFFGVLIVVVFLFMALGPLIRRFVAPWLQRWMLGKMEDNVRRMAGMPTRKEEKKARRQQKRRNAGGAQAFRDAAAASRSRSARNAHPGSPASYMQVFAEDVEFTEIKEFGSPEDIGTKKAPRESSFKVEEQVEDVEFTEIKIKE